MLMQMLMISSGSRDEEGDEGREKVERGKEGLKEKRMQCSRGMDDRLRRIRIRVWISQG